MLMRIVISNLHDLKFFEGNFVCSVAFLFFDMYQNPQKLMTKSRQTVGLSVQHFMFYNTIIIVNQHLCCICFVLCIYLYKQVCVYFFLLSALNTHVH